MTKDANEIAAETARRESRWREDLQPPRPDEQSRKPVVGELNVWPAGDVHTASPAHTLKHTTIDLRVSPGALVAYYGDGVAEIIGIGPNFFAIFEPDKE